MPPSVCSHSYKCSIRVVDNNLTYKCVGSSCLITYPDKFTYLNTLWWNGGPTVLHIHRFNISKDSTNGHTTWSYRDTVQIYVHWQTDMQTWTHTYTGSWENHSYCHPVNQNDGNTPLSHLSGANKGEQKITPLDHKVMKLRRRQGLIQ